MLFLARWWSLSLKLKLLLLLFLSLFLSLLLIGNDVITNFGKIGLQFSQFCDKQFSNWVKFSFPFFESLLKFLILKQLRLLKSCNLLNEFFLNFSLYTCLGIVSNRLAFFVTQILSDGIDKTAQIDEQLVWHQLLLTVNFWLYKVQALLMVINQSFKDVSLLLGLTSMIRQLRLGNIQLLI